MRTLALVLAAYLFNLVVTASFAALPYAFGWSGGWILAFAVLGSLQGWRIVGRSLS